MSQCNSTLMLFDRKSNTTLFFLKMLDDFRQLYNPIHGYICVLMCVFGVVTNLIHMIVLTRPNMRTSAVNAILCAVAICDISLMTSYLLYILNFVFGVHQHCYNPYTSGWLTFLLWHVVLSIAMHTTSLWLAVLMAFVRRMTLKMARLNSIWQQPRQAWKMSVGVYAAVFLMCAPTMLVHDIRRLGDFAVETTSPTGGGWCRTPDGRPVNATMYTIRIADVALAHNCRVFKANLWLTGIIFKVVPCLLLMVLSIDLVSRLRAAERKRNALFAPGRAVAAAASGPSTTATPLVAAKQTRTRGVTDRTTVMLIAILAVFLITELPQGAIAILDAIYTQDVHTVIYLNLGDVLDLLSLTNSSVNFVLMCIMSSRYRHTFWTVVLPERVHRRLCAGAYDEAADQQTVVGRMNTTTLNGGVGAGVSPRKKKASLSASSRLLRQRWFGATDNTPPSGPSLTDATTAQRLVTMGAINNNHGDLGDSNHSSIRSAASSASSAGGGELMRQGSMHTKRMASSVRDTEGGSGNDRQQLFAKRRTKSSTAGLSPFSSSVMQKIFSKKTDAPLPPSNDQSRRRHLMSASTGGNQDGDRLRHVLSAKARTPAAPSTHVRRLRRISSVDGQEMEQEVVRTTSAVISAAPREEMAPQNANVSQSAPDFKNTISKTTGKHSTDVDNTSLNVQSKPGSLDVTLVRPAECEGRFSSTDELPILAPSNSASKSNHSNLDTSLKESSTASSVPLRGSARHLNTFTSPDEDDDAQPLLGLADLVSPESTPSKSTSSDARHAPQQQQKPTKPHLTSPCDDSLNSDARNAPKYPQMPTTPHVTSPYDDSTDSAAPLLLMTSSSASTLPPPWTPPPSTTGDMQEDDFL